uniref:EOG090X0GY7 n=1 Tax=Evadne anonyx TaxID=141404 RepID=A0A9N6ZEB9_9CRUS|nr:EOG090X0GY7 [Evadne anonyx]
MATSQPIDVGKHRFPFCIVWTPIPLITWMLPFIGHMGIATSSGAIRDFAGSYFVSEDNMAFGSPTKYIQLEINKVPGGVTAWDRAVHEASEEYKNHTHNIFSDNCHSHVALVMNMMNYPGKRNWNMVSLCWQIIIKGKYISVAGYMKTWLPFYFLVALTIFLMVFFK